jgi:phosphohistidine phosphatase
MELYFLRHGIAADRGPEGSGDAGRPLTEEGIIKMERAVRALPRIEVIPDALISSPLVRARETADIVARHLKLDMRIDDALSPGCSLERLLPLLKPYATAQQVMVVGHEPDFSEMIAALTGGSRVVLKKGGLARVDLYDLETGYGVLMCLLPPRVLRALCS